MTRTRTTRPAPVDDWDVKSELARIEREKPKKKAPKKIRTSAWKGYRDAVRGFLQSGDWSGANARHLVALHAILHECVYSVLDGDLLLSAERSRASFVAASLTKREFGGQVGAAVDYMRWAWTREEQREKWRRDRGISGPSRLNWYRLFNGSLVTEYRIDRARNHGSHDAGGKVLQGHQQ